jgi:hypothetical protein
MGWWQDLRQRNETATERLVRHPFLGWGGHAAVFVGFSLLLQLARGGPIDWVRSVVMGAAIAAAVVAGTVVAHRVRRSRER